MPNDYIIYVKETEAARGQIKVDRLLVINPGGGNVGLKGEETARAGVRPAGAVDRPVAARRGAVFRGLTVVEQRHDHHHPPDRAGEGKYRRTCSPMRRRRSC